MELTYYSDLAVRLVNSEEPERGQDGLTSVAAVQELCGPDSEMARRVTESDVSRLRTVRTQLRAVFSAAGEGDETRAVDLLNSLLMEFPTSPQISGHGDLSEEGRPRWHMHLAEHPATAAAGYTATACMGLAFHLTGFGVDRLGICQAPPCRNAYLDTTTNRSRRYCSDRCATRANVAAYRARKRATERETGDRASSGRTAENAHTSTGRSDR